MCVGMNTDCVSLCVYVALLEFAETTECLGEVGDRWMGPGHATIVQPSVDGANHHQRPCSFAHQRYRKSTNFLLLVCIIAPCHTAHIFALCRVGVVLGIATPDKGMSHE